MFKVGDYVTSNGTDVILKIVYIGSDHGYKQWAIFEYVDSNSYSKKEEFASYCEIKTKYGNKFTQEEGKYYTYFPIDFYEVKIAMVKNTKLARKMFPDAEQSDCGEYLIGDF